jgi:outer membrane protein
MRAARAAAALFLLLGTASVVRAQGNIAVLTLEEALTLARQYNPAYQRAVVQADASGASVRAGFGAFLPSLSANIGWNGNSSTIVSGQDDFGRPVELPEPLGYRSSSTSQGLSSSLTLFDGLQNLNNYRAAKSASDASYANVAEQQASVTAEVTRRFYSALQAERLIGVEEQILAVSRQQLEATERLFRVAARTEVDVLGAQSSVAQQEQALEQARGNARKATLSLAQIIGLEEVVALQVSGELPEPFDPTALDPDSLVATARRQSPSVAYAQAYAAQAAYSASAAKGRYWPTVSARASLSRSMNLSSYEALFTFNPKNRGFGFGIDISVPIFTRFQTSDAVAQAVAQARSAQESLREADLQLERDVRSAHIDLVTAYRSLQLAQRGLDLSRRRLAMAQEQYQLGTIGFTDFQVIVTQSSEDARRLINAQLEFARATVTLEELVGETVRPAGLP